MLVIAQTPFCTPLGIGVVCGSSDGICRIDLPSGVTPKTARYATSDLTRQVASLLECYFSGQRVNFAGLPVDLSGLPLFQQRLLALTAMIPYGQVATYGRLAAVAGHPGAARAVGGAMAANPVPVLIPCHRVVAASGRLTGYSGPGGLVMKKWLLDLEGLEFRGQPVKTKNDRFAQEFFFRN